MRSRRAEMLRRAAPALAVLALLAGCQPGPGPGAYDPSAVAYERAIVLTVNFDFDSYRIRPDSYAVLDNTAAALNDPRLYGEVFEVNGHTDITGRFGYNVALSRLRAEAVADYLAARGVARERMRAQGFGPLQLIDPYNPRSPANRRVEIVALRR